MKHKYIRLDNDQIIVWPMSDLIWHRHIAHACQREMPHKIISAGFAEINEEECYCYGRSESLGLDSKHEDTEILCSQLGKQKGV